MNRKMLRHDKINYIEFPARDMAATKSFFGQVFGWEFTDYGDEYSASSTDGIEVGIFQSDSRSLTEHGAALVVFYSEDLESTLDRIKQAGGQVIRPIFSFPGGRRFQFTEPSGNELSVWSDK